MYCKECGYQIADDSKFCASCGKSLQAENSIGYMQTGNAQDYQPQPKSQVIAFILCFFLGGLDFHRFYVGKIGTGILMLLIGPFVIFGMTASEMADISGRGLSERGSTIVTISTVFAIILGIWILIDLVRILTGSFTEVSSQKYVDSGKSENNRLN